MFYISKMHLYFFMQSYVYLLPEILANQENMTILKSYVFALINKRINFIS